MTIDCASTDKNSDFWKGVEELHPKSYKIVQEHLESIKKSPKEAKDSGSSDTAKLIVSQCEAIENLLLEKNAKYGNSVAQPLNVLGKGQPLDLIAIRLDDKLKRIQNMGGLSAVLKNYKDSDDEDTVMDTICYLILAQVVHKASLNGS